MIITSADDNWVYDTESGWLVKSYCIHCTKRFHAHKALFCDYCKRVVCSTTCWYGHVRKKHMLEWKQKKSSVLVPHMAQSQLEQVRGFV